MNTWCGTLIALSECQISFVCNGFGVTEFVNDPCKCQFSTKIKISLQRLCLDADDWKNSSLNYS